MGPQALVPGTKIGVIAALGAPGIREDQDTLLIIHEGDSLGKVGRTRPAFHDESRGGTLALAHDAARAARYLGHELGAEADKVIRTILSMNGQQAYAEGCRAMLIMRREQDFFRAQRMLTEVLQRGSGGQMFIRRLRAVAAASAGDVRIAREDLEFLKVRGAPESAAGIEARIKLAQRDYDGAENELAKVNSLSAQDELLRARILEARASDSATPFADRERLRYEAAEIRARNRMLHEYEVEY